MGIFLAAHGKSYTTIRIPGTSFLNNMAPILQNFFLALNLILQSFLNSLKGVNILHLCTSAQHIRAFWAERNIQIRTEIAFLHFAIGNINILENRLYLLHIKTSFLWSGHIRLRNNLYQRYASTIVIYIRGFRILNGVAGVNQLACILLHMNAGNANPLLALGGFNIYITMLADWQIILGSLPILWQIWIIVVFTVKFGKIIDFAIQGQTSLNSKFQYSFIQNWQYTRQAQTYRTYMGIVLCTKGGGATTEYLSFCF